MGGSYVLTDIDDVLLDWFGGFRQYCQAKKIKMKPGYPSTWYLGDHVETNDILRLIDVFNNSVPFGFLTPIPGAVSRIQKLKKDGFKIVGISACTDVPKSVERRKRNLLTTFGDCFEDIICLSLGNTKKGTLKRFPPSIWIEDKWEGAIEGIEFGHDPIILTKPYNAKFSHPEIQRAENWEEIYELVRPTAALYKPEETMVSPSP